MARWRAFDWDAFDGRLLDAPTLIEATGIIILEGVYSARPELADLLDLRVLIDIEDTQRLARLHRCAGEPGPWERQWHAAENDYFDAIMPVERFDILFRAATGIDPSQSDPRNS